jgi:hypothetical protein
MVFLGQDPVRCKIIVGKYLQQVKNVKYLGCEISSEDGKNIQQRIAKFSQILGIPNKNCNLIPNNTYSLTLVQKFSRIKVYNVLAFPIPLYGSKNFNCLPPYLTILKNNKTKLKTA